MKNIYKSIVAGLLAVCGAGVITSCSNEEEAVGKGTVRFDVNVDDYVQVKTREVNTSELEKTCVLYVYQGNNIVRKYRGISRLEELVLYSGQYTAEAYAGEYVPASFEKQYFEGSTDFTVNKGEIANVNVACKIANSVVSVSTDEHVGDVLEDISFEVSSSEGSLTFAGETFGLKGYFMMPPEETTLKYTLKGKNLTGDIGGEFVRTGTIENVKPATEYAVTVTYNKQAGQYGGAYFDLKIDEYELVKERNEVLEAAPNIAAPNDRPLGEEVVRKGELNQYVVYVASVSSLKSIDISCDRFPSMGMNQEFDLITTSAMADINSYGIFMEDKTLPEDAEEGKQLKMIEFNETFFEKLNNALGEFVIKFSATDSKDVTTNATLTFVITEDKVIAVKVPAVINYNSVTLQGSLADEHAVNPGFEYREADVTRASGEWIKATDVNVSGSTITAVVSGLRAGASYEYRVVWDGMTTETPVYSFTTKSYPQVQNAGFEEWGQFKSPNDSKNILTPSANLASLYWDCGNHGSATMNKNVTEQDATYKHSGNYSAKLRSQFVGVGSIGKFAAGNIFIGQYLKTDGTDGIIGFGRPFDFPVENGKVIRPKALKVWVRYEPGQGVSGKGANSSYIGEGKTDQGQIYIALCGESGDSNDTYDGVSYGRVVRTKADDQRLFDADADNVNAYGQVTFAEATRSTDASGMMEITIPFTDKKTAVVPKYLIIVASASKYGDYFSGGEGSTMWLDDVELVYE